MQNQNSICSDGKTDYFTLINQEKVFLYQNNDLLYEIKKSSNVVSAICKNNYYLYTKDKDNHLFGKILDIDKAFECVLEEYEQLYLLKFLSNTMKVLVCGVDANRKKEELFIYDLINNKIICKFPSEIRRDTCYDMALQSDYIHVMGLFQNKISRYADDLDREDIYLATYEIIGTETELIDKLSVICIFDDFEEKSFATVCSLKEMQFPLFDQFLYSWLIEKSLSASGKLITYYSSDFHGLVISYVTDGQIFKLVGLPQNAKKEDMYYYNDYTGILSVLSANGDGVRRFLVSNSAHALGNEVEILNKQYMHAKLENINLQKHDEGSTFKRTFFRALDATCLECCKKP